MEQLLDMFKRKPRVCADSRANAGNATHAFWDTQPVGFFRTGRERHARVLGHAAGRIHTCVLGHACR